MTIQQVVFHKDSFQIHIDKEYHDGILIHEKHYDIHGNTIYKYYDNITVRFYREHIETENTYYVYTDFNNPNINNKVTKITMTTTSRFNDERNYPMDIASCTHLCTLNNDDAISYIKNYIKQYILKSHDL